MRRRIVILSFFGLAVVAAVVALAVRLSGSREPDPWGEKPRPRVVVSLPPLASFVRNVAGPNVPIVCLCTEQGPGAYEPTPADAAVLRHADLFLTCGLGVDDRLADDLASKAPKVRSRKLAEGLPAGLGSNEGDPRVWLSLSRAAVLVTRTRDELKAVDPARAADYERNADRYVAELRRAEAEGKKAVAGKKDRRILSLQGPLRHYAENFGLEVVASYQLGDRDTESAAYREVLEHCTRPGGVRVLAGPPGLARTATALELSKALQAKKVLAALVEVDPMETARPTDLAHPEFYLARVNTSLARILKHLP